MNTVEHWGAEDQQPPFSVTPDDPVATIQWPPMKVAALWRYPIKSMRGEQLSVAELTADGVYGDRTVQVFDRRGRLITARTHPALLGHQGTLAADGEPMVDGYLWTTSEAGALVVAAAGPGAHLRRVDASRFDVLPLLVATDGALEAFGHNARRLRPNLVVGGVDGLQEREWEGRRLQVGVAVVALDSLRARCVMTTFDPMSLAQDTDILRDIVRRFDGTICLNASVITPGRVSVGDSVALL